MTARGPLWRAIVWSERFLPKAPAVERVVTHTSMSRGQRLMMAACLLFACGAPALSAVLRDRGAAVHAAWPVWQPMLVQLTVVAAGAAALAAVLAGAIAWRRAVRDA